MAICKSALGGSEVTLVVTVAVLLAASVSVVAEITFAVLLIIVDAGAFWLTLTTILKVALSPGAT